MAKSSKVKPMTEFNKEAAVTLRPELNAALEEIAKRFGITIQVGKMRYNQLEIKAEIVMQPAKPSTLKLIQSATTVVALLP